ncbi:MAG: cell division protein ZapA [Pseudomonadota bacterium]
MAVHNIEIGGRIFEVVCREGEEDFLNAAAQRLDEEARVVADAQGNIGGSRMLLMSGLMLADRMLSVEALYSKLKEETEQRELLLEREASAEPIFPSVIQEPSDEAKALRADIAKKDTEIADLKDLMVQLSADLSKTAEEDRGLRAQMDELQAKLRSASTPEPAEPAADPSLVTKLEDELDHRRLQVGDLMARLSTMQSNMEEAEAKSQELKKTVPEPDPYLEATIEAEKDETGAELQAAKEELDGVQAELLDLKQDRDSRSKAESQARDQLEAEISQKSNEIKELQEEIESASEMGERLFAAEKTIERMIAMAEVTAEDLSK